MVVSSCPQGSQNRGQELLREFEQCQKCVRKSGEEGEGRRKGKGGRKGEKGQERREEEERASNEQVHVHVHIQDSE